MLLLLSDNGRDAIGWGGIIPTRRLDGKCITRQIAWLKTAAPQTEAAEIYNTCNNVIRADKPISIFSKTFIFISYQQLSFQLNLWHLNNISNLNLTEKRHRHVIQVSDNAI